MAWTPELMVALRNDLHANHKLTRELLEEVRNRRDEAAIRETSRAIVLELHEVFALMTATLQEFRTELAASEFGTSPTPPVDESGGG